MILDEIGLSPLWRMQFHPLKMDTLVQQCINWKPPVAKLTKLPLKSLSGAFLVLCVGYLISICTLLMEFFITWFQRLRIKQKGDH